MTKTHMMYGTKLYNAWANMKKRCDKPTGRDGKNYETIEVCDEWNDFIPFMEWALNNGYEDKLTLDRKNNYGNYTPENCHWTTMTEQQRNKTNTKWITYNGKTQSLTSWAEELSFEKDTLKSRILRGWNVERAFTENLGEGRIKALNTRKRDEGGRLL